MSLAIFPYMSSRGTFPLSKADLYGPGLALYPYNGTITFRWGVAQTGFTPPKSNYILTALGQWGGVSAQHIPIVVLCPSLPAATNTYATEAAMQADLDIATPELYVEFDTTSATIAGVGTKRWLCFKKDGVRYWVPYRVRIASGTATIATKLCDIFYTTIDAVDIPKVNNETMDADEVFDLCWAVNGRHASDGYDAAFKLTPVGVKLQDAIVERIELNARVAGQRAIKKDEMITRSQLEAGNFITLGYRDAAGELMGYVTDASKGFNIVIESADHRLIAGTNIVTSIVSSTDFNADAWGSGTFSSGLTKVLFSDEPDWVLDSSLQAVSITHNSPTDQWGNTSLPVKWIYYHQGGGEAYFSARTLHNGLWASHNNLTTTTPKGAGPYDTLAHIQFKDTASVTWSITNANLESDVGYRPGIIVEANAPNDNCDQPAIQTRWWFTPRYNRAYDDISAAAEYFFGLRNGPGCNAEMTFSPWGPVTDTIGVPAEASIVEAEDCFVPPSNVPFFEPYQIRHEAKYRSAGSFRLGDGRQGHKKQLVEDRLPYHRYPFVNGALYVNKTGYYHISTEVVLALQRWMMLTLGHAVPHEYYSYMGFWLMVYRGALGSPVPRWYMHSRLDMQEVVHVNERDLVTNQEAYSYTAVQINRLQSRRVAMQGSTDVYLREDDGVCLMITMHGNDGSTDSYPPQNIENASRNGILYMRSENMWCAALTKLEFNMHWLHNAYECNDANYLNLGAHPGAFNNPGLSLDYMDDSWELPIITQPYLKDFH